MPPYNHNILMETIRAVRNDPQLPWLSVDPESIPQINKALDYWINDLLKTETVESITKFVRWVDYPPVSFTAMGSFLNDFFLEKQA